MIKKNTINRVDDLNKSSVSCSPCKKEAEKIHRKMIEETMNKLKIDGVKNCRFNFSNHKK